MAAIPAHHVRHKGSRILASFHRLRVLERGVGRLAPRRRQPSGCSHTHPGGSAPAAGSTSNAQRSTPNSQGSQHMRQLLGGWALEVGRWTLNLSSFPHLPLLFPLLTSSPCYEDAHPRYALFWTLCTFGFR